MQAKLNILFKNPRKTVNFTLKLKINRTKLYPSKSIKYLGVWIDSDLSWKSQIINTLAKLKRANGHWLNLDIMSLKQFLH